jgi:hypothetical protein
MGRSSRRKGDLRNGRREPSTKEDLRSADKAQRRGRRCGSTLIEYEALACLHEDRTYAALMARHNARMQNIARPLDRLLLTAMDALAPVPVLDVILRQCGADPRRLPANYGGKWVDHLAWGVDSMVAALRLLMSGQFVGAALVARHQLERWSNHRAYLTDTRHRVGEPSLDYIARIWSAPVIRARDQAGSTGGFDAPAGIDLDAGHGGQDNEPRVPHEHVALSDGAEVCPAAVMGALGDVLHALTGTAAMRWDAVDRCDPGTTPAQVHELYELVGAAVRLCSSQIAYSLRFIAAERNDLEMLVKLNGMPDGLSYVAAEEESGEGVGGSGDEGQDGGPVWPAHPPGTVSRIPLVALLPMHPDHGLRRERVRALCRGAQIFESAWTGKPAGRLFKDDEFMSLAFSWHRYAVARGALTALKNEREALGENWNLEGLRARELPYLLTSEVAGLVCAWSGDGPVADAAAVISTSIRSAYWLWLEDDDRAMGVLRTTLEQTARIRTWRRRPDKARKLETSGRTTPRDWLEAAGLRRLEALNRALGEMAHARIGSRWHGARDLLAQLQPSPAHEMSIYTARGFCLDTMVLLAGHELVAATRPVSPAVAAAFATVLKLDVRDDDQPDTEIESLMNRAFARRADSLGLPTLRGPELRWAHASESARR